ANCAQQCLTNSRGLTGAQSRDFNSKALWQFRGMIKCSIPDSNPLLEFNNYGCYCGYGGGGTPVDTLDQCCFVHDNCYGDTMEMEECWPIFDNPYTEIYAYTCDDSIVKCTSDNGPCEMAICECDRKAALCFSKAEYHEEHKNLDQYKYCS
uniref:Phospholipase A2 n=1 Tax=Callorhinchus milii TaxID=7868 RepID=A0A4W3IIW6_CALMI